MKNIILVDRSCELIDEFIARGCRIVVLVVETHEQAQAYRAAYTQEQIEIITHRFAVESVVALEYLDYELIESFRDTQRKIEFTYHRDFRDTMLVTNKYFNALCWWNHIFDTHSIDFVFNNAIEHILLCELCLPIAQKRGIPAFCAPTRLLFAPNILDYATKSYIPLCGDTLNDEQLAENFYFHFDFGWIPPFYQKHSKVGNAMMRLLLRLGGSLLVDFLVWVRNVLVGKEGSRFKENLLSYVQLLRMKHHYKKISTQPKEGEKFIFYAIQFEPEGNTSVCVPLQNQLSVIQMLSRALPEGYKLYVKEHPMQFSLNKPRMYYYLYNFGYFKNRSFYKELEKLPNVRFIDLDVSSKELNQKALAVATINGTVHLEATFFGGKPCIVFGGHNMLLKNAKNIVYVESFEDLYNGVRKLLENPQSFVLSEAEIHQYKAYIKARSIYHQSPTKARDMLDSVLAYLAERENA